MQDVWVAGGGGLAVPGTTVGQPRSESGRRHGGAGATGSRRARADSVLPDCECGESMRLPSASLALQQWAWDPHWLPVGPAGPR
jgi:hypothetical protein